MNDQTATPTPTATLTARYPLPRFPLRPARNWVAAIESTLPADRTVVYVGVSTQRGMVSYQPIGLPTIPPAVRDGIRADGYDVDYFIVGNPGGSAPRYDRIATPAPGTIDALGTVPTASVVPHELARAGIRPGETKIPGLGFVPRAARPAAAVVALPVALPVATAVQPAAGPAIPVTFEDFAPAIPPAAPVVSETPALDLTGVFDPPAADPAPVAGDPEPAPAPKTRRRTR